MPLDHERHMRRAIALAGNNPQFPFGTVLVRRDDGAVAAEGFNRSGRSPILHGEIDGLNNLFAAGRGAEAAGLALYTTAEPCPMCMAAILWSGVRLVVYGTSIRTLQASGWRQIDILSDEVVRRAPGWECEVIGGVLAAECDALFAAGPPGKP